MPHSWPVIALAVFGILAFCIFVIFKKGQENDGETENVKEDKATRYVSLKRLLSDAEFSFFKVLKLAVSSDYSVQVKVRIADLVKVSDETHGKNAWKSNGINQKHADFVLCDHKNMEICAVIELDDASHGTKKAQKRDAFIDAVYSSAKIPCIHIAAARDYNPNELAETIRKAVESAVRTGTVTEQGKTEA